ncbi:MAG TPA: hypothetical protein VJV23_00350 [Candidatus Polarisedimenticolia bacterium]|nr:hypothetical protein [Candidatus Polarisedimenticolia bacterium]
MPARRPPSRVDIYRRRRGTGEKFRLLLSEEPSGGPDPLVLTRQVLDGLQREFPEYEYLVVLVRRDPKRRGT